MNLIRNNGLRTPGEDSRCCASGHGTRYCRLAALAPPPPAKPNGNKIDELREAAGWLRDATVVIDITETHLSRPLADPACAVLAFNTLRNFGVDVVLPSSPPAGWKEALLASGKFQDRKADYLLEGEGMSSFAAEIQGMTSCRARVELRLVPVPGRDVLVTGAGIGAEVDLVEALAAKAAIEEATEQALGELLRSGNKRLTGAN